MISFNTIDVLLKNVYLNVITEQINNKTNPFYSAIEKTSLNIEGKNILFPMRLGISGGFSASTEYGSLPMASENYYKNLSAPIRNLYGCLEISDKVLRASRTEANSMLGVLEKEMDALLAGCKYNFSRMLWQNGKGVLNTVGDLTSHTALTWYPVTSLKNLQVGMIVDFVSTGGTVLSSGHRITDLNATLNKMTFTPAVSSDVTMTAGTYITVQNSYSLEIYGIPYLFDDNISDLYGVSRATFNSLKPLSSALNGALTVSAIQNLLDSIESNNGNGINMLVSGFDVRRAYLSAMASSRLNVDYMNVDGGFKALSYNGIPFVADKFCSENTSLFALNTDDFKLVQLCDWEWLEGDNGKILYHVDGKPIYSATVVKYANLACKRPYGQGRLTGITI